MMVVTKDEFFIEGEKYAAKIEDGDVFVYPTDTIYGLGCDATNETAVLKLRNTKRQHDRPLSVIVPSLEWIEKNCVMTEEAKGWLKKLPGPYTLILKLKNDDAVAKSITDTGSVGVRMPDHPISKFVSVLGLPVVTTSANISGNMFMTSIDDIDSEIKTKADFIVDGGDIKGHPSDIIFLDKEKVEIRQR